MQKKQLQKMVEEGKSTYVIAVAIGKGQTTVRYWLKKYGLKTNPNFFQSFYLCKYCGEDQKEKMANMGQKRRCKTICQRCHSQKNKERQREKRRKAVEHKGGKCQKCEYDLCIGALDFHHRDPEDKDPGWVTMRGWSWKRIKEELNKCDLLCCRCHREKHAGVW